jgi:hypothetical protein
MVLAVMTQRTFAEAVLVSTGFASHLITFARHHMHLHVDSRAIRAHHGQIVGGSRLHLLHLLLPLPQPVLLLPHLLLADQQHIHCSQTLRGSNSGPEIPTRSGPLTKVPVCPGLDLPCHREVGQDFQEVGRVALIESLTFP